VRAFAPGELPWDELVIWSTEQALGTGWRQARDEQALGTGRRHHLTDLAIGDGLASTARRPGADADAALA
jgi:hypothetical protein